MGNFLRQHPPSDRAKARLYRTRRRLGGDPADSGLPRKGHPHPNPDTDTDAGNTDPDAGNADPDAGNTDANAGNTDSDAGDTDPDTGNADPHTGDTDADADADAGDRKFFLRDDMTPKPYPCPCPPHALGPGKARQFLPPPVPDLFFL